MPARPSRGGTISLCIALAAWFAIWCAPSAVCGQPKAGVQSRPPLNVALAEAQGKALVESLLARAPEASVRTNTLRVRTADGQTRQTPVRFEIAPSAAGGWTSTYEVMGKAAAPGIARLSVTSRPGALNEYTVSDQVSGTERKLPPAETTVPFAGSDFWVADLGLEFLHWPRQLLLRKELRKGQSCDVLESINTGGTGYGRIVSWIDIDTGGIVHADAYDPKGKLLKQFDPSELQKVNGQMQVKEIEIRNRQTGGRSWVSFDLE